MDALRCYLDRQLENDIQHRPTFFGAGRYLNNGTTASVFRAAKTLGRALEKCPKYDEAIHLKCKIDEKLASYIKLANLWIFSNKIEIGSDFPDLCNFLEINVRRLSVDVILSSPDHKRNLLASLCQVALRMEVNPFDALLVFFAHNETIPSMDGDRVRPAAFLLWSVRLLRLLNGVTRGEQADLVCNECWAVVRTVGELERTIHEMGLSFMWLACSAPIVALCRVLEGSRNCYPLGNGRSESLSVHRRLRLLRIMITIAGREEQEPSDPGNRLRAVMLLPKVSLELAWV